MSDELRTSVAAVFSPTGKLPIEFKKAGVTLTITGTKAIRNRQTVGTSVEALELGEITDPHLFVGYNEDSTNYIEVRHGSSGDDVVKIPPSSVVLFYFATTTPYVIANTAACSLDYLVVQA